MKKICRFIIIIISFTLMISCGNGVKDGGYEIALITEGTIDDKSFNQGAWEGLTQYADEKGKTYKYYQPTQKTTDGYIDSIDLAVAASAKLIITPNYLFETAIYKSQDNHPDITFVLLDGVPQDGNYTDFRIEKNVYSVLYAEEQAGFLAGYAIVKEGYTNLGVIGGMAVPPVIRFGYGFVQGAQAYAKAKEMPAQSVEIRYAYADKPGNTPENQAVAKEWFQNGAEAIFTIGYELTNGVIAAAEEFGKQVIGADINWSDASQNVAISAVKHYSQAVQDLIDLSYNEELTGGSTVQRTAAENGIALTMDDSHLKNFTRKPFRWKDRTPFPIT